MIKDSDLKEITPKPLTSQATSTHVATGVPIPKAARVRAFSPDEWEDFIEEWSTSLNGTYKKIRRLGGAGDLGVDIVGFCTDNGFKGDWDNYQCKRYDHPLRPSDIWVELGKIIFYASRGEYTPPRKHYFVCSQGIGTSLEKLLNKPQDLKVKAKENWDKYCAKGITTTSTIPLEGSLKEFFDGFNFGIFTSKSHIELIEEHRNTGFHTVRFGGGLPPRPPPGKPPSRPTEAESRYIRQLLDAYGDCIGSSLDTPEALECHPNLKRDFLVQRERFYHAESLRNFSRDTVPEGTFAALQEEIYYGVFDVYSSQHMNGFARMKATIIQATSFGGSSNPLSPVTKIQDQQGICHQLANDDRLIWVLNGD